MKFYNINQIYKATEKLFLVTDLTLTFFSAAGILHYY